MQHTRQEEIEMMQTPDKWPLWPRLPLKRPGYTYGLDGTGYTRDDSLGYLFNGSMGDENTEPKVYIGSIFDNVVTDEPEYVEYTDFDAILDDGWVID